MIGKIFIIIGIAFILIGLFLIFFRNFPLFHLPGDIVVEKENFSFYFPITSMILISVILSLIFNFISKLK
jgi:phosphoglycerol transferase MdoB-like AlkP superfamily enzyme